MLTIITRATTADLTVLATAKRELGIADADTSQDARLGDLICEASSLVAQYCNREHFGRETYRQTERVARETDCLILERDLKPEVIHVEIGGIALEDDEWELDGSLLYRLWGDYRILWPAGARVVIEYNAGFTLLTDLPRAIERACLDVLTVLHGGSADGLGTGRDVTVRTETTEAVGSVTYFDSRATPGKPAALPIAADRLVALDRYRRVVIA